MIVTDVITKRIISTSSTWLNHFVIIFIGNIRAVRSRPPRSVHVRMNRTDRIREKEERDLWGYAVCFGTALTFIAGIGHVNSFGLIYNDFIIDTQSTAKSLTTAHGVFAIMLAIGGIILNILTKSMSMKIGGLIGAAIFTLGSLTTITITSTNQLPLTFGVLQGIGFGMMVPVSYSTINHYFVKKRTTVMSAIKALQGVILMWYPQVLKLVIFHYGFRGTLLIISGISLHTIPGMMVMDNKPTAGKRTSLEKGPENDDLLRNKEQIDIAKGNAVCSKTKNLRVKLMEILNLRALKDPVYRNICIGQSFANFSDLTFFIFQPMLLFQYGYTTSEVATCISICAGADLAGRCVLVLISSISSINTRLLFFAATLLTFVLRIVILQIRSFIWVAIVTGALGVFRAWLHVSSPLVISNHVSHEDFPGAYALFMLTAGFVNVIFSPLVGLLKDIYKDYIPAFYALTVCCLPCLITWPIEYFYRKKSQN